MTDFPKKLQQKLKERHENNALRCLSVPDKIIDFSSNDYLGFANSPKIYEAACQLLIDKGIVQNGATGSRLLSGNSLLYIELEEMLASFHRAEATLVFNSGYDANVGFFASVPQREDVIFYDELIHASIRDGITLGLAKSYKFKHNDLEDLESAIARGRNTRNPEGEIYIVTESVFSMDGDSPDLCSLTEICTRNNYRLVIDEAHAVGVFGPSGAGRVQEFNLEDLLFARIVTFGKAMGCHGAAILGSKELKSYLVNFARSFIYTTGLPPHSLSTILSAYRLLSDSNNVGSEKREEHSPQSQIISNICFFNQKLDTLNLQQYFIPSQSAIHCCIVPNNERAKRLAIILRQRKFDVKPILSPTIPKGMERLRICLHSYNTREDILKLLETLGENLMIE